MIFSAHKLANILAALLIVIQLTIAMLFTILEVALIIAIRSLRLIVVILEQCADSIRFASSEVPCVHILVLRFHLTISGEEIAMPLTTVFNQLWVIEILLIALTIPLIILKTTNIFISRCHYFRVAMRLAFLPFAEDLVTIRVCHSAITTSFTVLYLSDIHCAIFVFMNDLLS